MKYLLLTLTNLYQIEVHKNIVSSVTKITPDFSTMEEIDSIRTEMYSSFASAMDSWRDLGFVIEKDLLK